MWDFLREWPLIRQLREGGDGTGPEAMSLRTRELQPKTDGAQVARSVCPYCAVGCGQLVYYRDGELVGEKRHIDNRLGLAILRRLDRLSETGSPLSCRDLPLSVRPAPSPVRPEPFHSGQRRGAPALDWDQMLGALRTGDPDAVATALAAFETHDPPNSTSASLTAAGEDD